MEPFKITMVGQVLTVHPLGDGSFDVFVGGNKLGNLVAELNEDTGLNKWTTLDLIPLGYVKQIGHLIEEYEM